MHRVARYIAQKGLLEKSDRVLVAVSGGADSVALLDILVRLGYSCVIAHCNFHLRGAESDRDQHFVETLAEQYRLPLFVRDFSTEQYAADSGISLEMAARELRYRWFEELRQQERCAVIAVAHHKNDQAETLILNLLRGTGIRGLAAMQPKNGKIIRQLLCLKRSEIQDYNTIRQLNSVVDSTNSDTHFKRNNIRQHLTAASEAQINHIAQTCEYVGDYKKIIDAYIADIRQKAVNRADYITEIDIAAILGSLSPKAVLYELLQPYGFNQTESIFRSLHATAGKTFRSSEYELVKDRNKLLISKLQQEKETKLRYTITFPKSFDGHFPAATDNEILVDADRLKGTLSIRHWQAGDFFYPLGMRGKKKLQDFFTDLHLSLPEKRKVQLLCCGKNIVWIIGYRLDDRYKVTPQTRRLAKICVSSE